MVHSTQRTKQDKLFLLFSTDPAEPFQSIIEILSFFFSGTSAAAAQLGCDEAPAVKGDANLYVGKPPRRGVKTSPQGVML